MNSIDNTQVTEASTVQVATMPWVFTQNHPLDSSSFVDEAKRRGFDLDLTTLRELYRHNLIVPFIYISDRRVGPVPPPITSEPVSGSTRLTDLRYARDRGRLSDLSATSFRPRLRFERDGVDPRRWWNGLIYSRYQILALPDVRPVLDARSRRIRDQKIITRLPTPDPFWVNQANRVHVIATVLTALEARYLPSLEPEWIHLVNTDEDEWRRYRESFDPTAMSRTLGYTATQARADAEWLLSCAHQVDPVGYAWSRLMRHAPRKAWKDLKDTALLAMDYREAAEILLRFYEDLADHSQAEKLPSMPRMSWHPLNERLSHRPDTLDQDLMQLGISPHPRVVLAVEGEAEEVHAPLVWKALGYPEAPELIRLLKLGGVDRDLEKVAALAAAPLVGGKVNGHDSWWLIKPPTRLLVAVDPEGGQFGSPEKIAKTKAKILREIEAVLKAQGVTAASASELDELVKIQTWQQSCYEFDHFADDELADGIIALHTDINGMTRDQLVQSVATERGRRKDIKEVWSQWNYKPSKEKLAHVLWPTLERKIQLCKVDPDAPVPSIAAVIQDAYFIAQRWRYQSFVLSEDTGTSSTESAK